MHVDQVACDLQCPALVDQSHGLMRSTGSRKHAEPQWFWISILRFEVLLVCLLKQPLWWIRAMACCTNAMHSKDQSAGCGDLPAVLLCAKQQEAVLWPIATADAAE
jgi:hypothetical protein